MSNQQNETNPQVNQKSFPQEEKFNLNINYILDNTPIEEIKKKIDLCIKEKNLSELDNFLSLFKGKINKKLLSNYISENLENIEIINIFLKSGADVNSYVNCPNYQINEEDKTNLLMFSMMTENTGLFKLVLQYHPDVLQEDKNKKNSVFYYITFNEDPNMLHDLLQLNEDAINSIYFDPENNITHNLLTFAVTKNKKDICSILIKYNCNVNYQIPETGETFLHLIVKNDNIEIAKLLYNHPNIDKSLKNKDGKTARELGEEKKGNIFFQIIVKENSNNKNININTNNNNNINLTNNETTNQKSNKKGNELFNKISENLNSNINDYENEKNYYCDNTLQDNYIVPIEFNNVDYNTYLSMGQEMKLCLNLFKEEDVLKKEKEKLLKQKEELENMRENTEKNIKEMIKTENDLNIKLKDCDSNIKEAKEQIHLKKTELTKLEEKNNKYKEYLKKIMEENQEQKENEQLINIDNINNEEQIPESEMNQPKKVNPLSRERFQFLIDKFESKANDRNYIVKCLQKDLEDYQKYIEDEIGRKKGKINGIIQQLQVIVNELDPNCKVNLYGSYSTGLCLPWSDIDTVITSDDGNYEGNFLSMLNLKLMQKKDFVKEQNFLDRASIPIIKLVSNDEFNFHIDISMSSENHFGLKTVELVKKYLEKYKVLKPIILALKTLLKNGSLNDPYKGGLSSYGLILMVVSFIQSEIDNEKYNEASPTILGETFLNVLGHYGIFFDYNNYVIITYPVDEKAENNEKENSFQFIPNTHELIIVDPLNNQNNVAKSTFQFMNIKMGFLIAFMVAKEDCECGCHYEFLRNERSMNHSHCILKRIFNSIKRFKDANKNIY
jgi:non-canonical poly(A) RNA polymerase PAPD5/7